MTGPSKGQDTRARRFAERIERDGRPYAPNAPAHGVVNTYSNWGCRCRPCTVAKLWADRGTPGSARNLFAELVAEADSPNVENYPSRSLAAIVRALVRTGGGTAAELAAATAGSELAEVDTVRASVILPRLYRLYLVDREPVLVRGHRRWRWTPTELAHELDADIRAGARLANWHGRRS